MGIGIIVGSDFQGWEKLSSPEMVKTPQGTVPVFSWKNFSIIQRHGEHHSIPPHAIDYHANLLAFKQLGISSVVGCSSVGSLKEFIPPGSIIIPDDFISLSSRATIFDKETIHIIPHLDRELRGRIIAAAKKARVEVKEKGVYFQTLGPRLETKAEIRMIKQFADVVGMTMGSEATIAQELGLKYISICKVANFAHGIGEEKLNFQVIRDNAKKNREDLLKIIDAVEGL
ncbi:MTAP family purine nucleoside phosphorylase [Candidatus Woesearchaeota archaeon]|nr:MTAP family purine nucleoside phosphorylase [Candidatus Woesearchaeota archaeon]HIH38099.1 MTAP family purine nucleoside phosphorylase [Candidatus Woesearchaeota archaeon]HIH48833.1 MTAP family purine nucleoside phosphorylase [Candidatus Woesearchaeota archaeon]HIJ03168.1 MTAP family purine nucleoside phosphorylase [Candidatus Woesearchaeota archaeon]